MHGERDRKFHDGCPWGEPLRFRDITSAIFTGNVKWDIVHNATVDRVHAPTINSGTDAPVAPPAAISVVHRGRSEKAFIQGHPAWFRQFGHESLHCRGTEDQSGSSVLPP
jgi:hypothetical protein